MTDIDRRFGTVELVERAGHNIPAVTGFAVVYYNPADPGTEFDMLGNGKAVERIMPGALSGVETRDVLALLQHNIQNVLGRTAAGTLKLTLEERGLRFWLDPPMTALGKSVTEGLRRGDLNGSSFGAFIKPGDDHWRHDGRRAIREIRHLPIHEISVVAKGAYPATFSTLTQRALDEYTTLRKPLALRKRELAIRFRR